MKSDQKLITDREAAQLLGCGRSTFWRWVNEGDMPPPIKICGMTRWYLTDVENYIRAAARKSRPKPQPRIRTRRRKVAA